MGVPGFFAWLLRKRLVPLQSSINFRPKRFYLDFNHIIHSKTSEVIENDFFEAENLNQEELEKTMLLRIKYYLEYLIGVVNPSESVYIAVDGVPPLAKVVQQRLRRYKQVQDDRDIKEIKRRHDRPVINWSNVNITPGTTFMQRLDRYLLEISEELSQQFGIKIYYSSYREDGEGEYKIYRDLRTNPWMDGSTDGEIGRTVIYGLDADLFFLSLVNTNSSSSESNKDKDKEDVGQLYLLREEFNARPSELYDICDVGKDLVFIDIGGLKSRLNGFIRRHIGETGEVDRTPGLFPSTNRDFSKDITVLLFLLGNDFLPFIPLTDIYKGGVELLLKTYYRLAKQGRHLVNDSTQQIDTDSFKEICHLLAQQEKREIERDGEHGDQDEGRVGERDEGEEERKGDKKSKRRKTKSDSKPRQKERRERCSEDDPYLRELWLRDHLVGFQVEEMTHPQTYYKHYGIDIEKSASNYLKGVVWVWKYYTGECLDWNWHQIDNHGCFFSDLYQYLVKEQFDFSKIEFRLDSPITLRQQLLLLAPPQRREMLPEKLQKEVESNKEFFDNEIWFPTQPSLDFVNKTYHWQALPLLNLAETKQLAEKIGK